MLRVLSQRKLPEEGKLVAVLSLMIRRVLLNHIRETGAQRRGGQVMIRLFTADDGIEQKHTEVDLLELHEMLEKLERLAPRQVQIIEMKYFGALSNTQIASYLEVSERTIQLDLMHARAWLAREISSDANS